MIKWMSSLMASAVTGAIAALCPFQVHAEYYCPEDQAYPLPAIAGKGDVRKIDEEVCAEFYRKHAAIQLGAEKRMPNGISWRLQTDTATGIGLPRVTWMPNAQNMKVVNRALDAVQGRLLVDSAYASEKIGEWNIWARGTGLAFRHEDHPLTQTRIEATYASSGLVSIVDLGFWASEGSYLPRHLRGLTIDIGRDRLYEIASCAGDDIPYAGNEIAGAERYLFRLGDFLRVCDVPTYKKFTELLEAKADEQARRALGSEQENVKHCLWHYIGDKKTVGENDELVLYLTFSGLAVHTTTFWPNSDLGQCVLSRSPLNPVIIPYRELEPFMTPGPWRDELLALH
jgi:hypothetical protein